MASMLLASSTGGGGGGGGAGDDAGLATFRAAAAAPRTDADVAKCTGDATCSIFFSAVAPTFPPRTTDFTFNHDTHSS